jgi:hypothetical protein
MSCKFYNVPKADIKRTVSPGDLIVNIHNRRINESEVRVLWNGTVQETRRGHTILKTSTSYKNLDEWKESLKDREGTLLYMTDEKSNKYKFQIVIR